MLLAREWIDDKQELVEFTRFINYEPGVDIDDGGDPINPLGRNEDIAT